MLLQLVSKWNNQIDSLSIMEREMAFRTLEWVDSFTGILKPSGSGDNTGEVVELALKLRKKLRAKKDFETADLVRSGLRDLGIYIEDNGEETTWWQE